MMLSYRWSDLCRHFNIEPEKRDLIFKIILERYTRPGRYYHTPKHIKHCLEELEEIKNIGLPIDTIIIEMAIWFHDFHYEIDENDNEGKSARHFQGIMQELIDQRILDEIVKCIMATKHDGKTYGLNSECMIDIDLAALGYEAGRFNKYWKIIRKEYPLVSDDDFNKGRLKILNKFAEREHIYYTPYFQNKYEKQARENIKRWNEKLKEADKND